MNRDGKWDTGTFVPLLIVSLIPCIGIVNIIAGAINLKKPARRSQALILLIIGIASTALLAANTNFQSGSDFGLGLREALWLR